MKTIIITATLILTVSFIAFNHINDIVNEVIILPAQEVQPVRAYSDLIWTDKDEKNNNN